MRALITGANGFLGSFLARRLAASGVSVRCLLRPGADRALLEGVEIEPVVGDVTRPESLAAAVEGVEVVYHLAGLRRAPARADFMRVNAEGTRHVCEAMVRGAPGARLVLCSSLAAVGPSRDFPDETAPLSPLDWYGESKAEAERIAIGFGNRLAVTLARPSRILGPGDRENLVLFKLAARGWRLSLGGGPRPISTIDVEDAAEALALMGERTDAVGEAFFVSRDTTTLEGLQEEVARAMGASPRTVHLPQAAFRAIAAAADVVSGATGRHLPINRKMAQQLLVAGWTCSVDKARERLGFRARVPMAQSLAAAAAWYRERGWI